jgi:hypothetical protein
MKTFLLPAIIAIAALMPFQQSEAAKFGGFKSGHKFNLKVEEVISVKTTGLFGKPTKVPIPSGLPKFNKKQKVTFKIGKKGELTAKGISLPFTTDGGTSNVYNKVVTGTSPKTDTAIIYKGADNKATGAALTFIRVSGSPSNPFDVSTYSLTYTLR